MKHRSHLRTITSLTASAALLAACGGGGSDAGGGAGALATDIAVAYAANATLIGNDAGVALDDAVVAAQAVVSTQASGTALIDPSQAVALPSLVAAVRVNCTGGGFATLTITGGTASSVLNGQFDVSESYTLVFNACRSAPGSAQIDGTLAFTVQSFDNGTASLNITATALRVAAPRGAVTINGSLLRTWSRTYSGSNSQINGRLTGSSVVVTTQYNGRSSTFTLSSVDMTRTAVWSGDVLQSNTVIGGYTLSANLPGGSFTYDAATSLLSYGADGTPVSGSWNLLLPRTLIRLTLASGNATVAVDDGNDSFFDRSVVVPVSRLFTDAG